jgi:integrase
MVRSSDSKSPKKPAPVVVGAVKAYATRPPCASDSRWYWQALGKAERGKRPTLWSGRATPEEIAEELALLVVAHGARPVQEEVQEARAIAEGLTVAQLLARWQEHVEATADKYAKNTRRNYKDQAIRLTADLGGYALTEVTPAMLERYHSIRIGAGASKGTADLSLRVLRTAWNWGRRNRLLTDVWPKPTIRLRDRTKRERPTSEQVTKVLAIMRKDAPEWCWRLAIVIGRAGMRVSEAWGLTVGDAEIARKKREIVGGALQIREQPGVAKTGARTVYISPTLAEEIAKWVRGRDPGERLIGKVTQSTATMGAANHLRPAAQAIGATWTGWHSFRRAAADAYAEANVDPVVAAAQLGHTVQVMQEVYRSVRGEQAQAAATAMDGQRPEKARLKAVEGDEQDASTGEDPQEDLRPRRRRVRSK